MVLLLPFFSLLLGLVNVGDSRGSICDIKIVDLYDLKNDITSQLLSRFEVVPWTHGGPVNSLWVRQKHLRKLRNYLRAQHIRHEVLSLRKCTPNKAWRSLSRDATLKLRKGSTANVSSNSQHRNKISPRYGDLNTTDLYNSSSVGFSEPGKVICGVFKDLCDPLRTPSLEKDPTGWDGKNCIERETYWRLNDLIPPLPNTKTIRKPYPFILNSNPGPAYNYSIYDGVVSNLIFEDKYEQTEYLLYSETIDGRIELRLKYMKSPALCFDKNCQFTIYQLNDGYDHRILHQNKYILQWKPTSWGKGYLAATEYDPSLLNRVDTHFTLFQIRFNKEIVMQRFPKNANWTSDNYCAKRHGDQVHFFSWFHTCEWTRQCSVIRVRHLVFQQSRSKLKLKWYAYSDERPVESASIKVYPNVPSNKTLHIKIPEYSEKLTQSTETLRYNINSTQYAKINGKDTPLNIGALFHRMSPCAKISHNGDNFVECYKAITDVYFRCSWESSFYSLFVYSRPVAGRTFVYEFEDVTYKVKVVYFNQTNHIVEDAYELSNDIGKHILYLSGVAPRLIKTGPKGLSFNIEGEYLVMNQIMAYVIDDMSCSSSTYTDYEIYP